MLYTGDETFRYPRTLRTAKVGATTLRSYNRTDYTLYLLEGEWPSDEELLRLLGAEPMCGGGTVSPKNDPDAAIKSVYIAGCD